jgi:hypothetical protein
VQEDLRFSPKADYQNEAVNDCKVRTADLYAKRSESPQSALHVEMCMAQHLSLSALGVE